MRKIASLVTVLMLLSAMVFGQQTRTVSGQVKDDKGEGVPFATILETGTKNGTKADVNGSFSIKIKEGSSLTVSASGFDPKTITPSGATVDVSLVTKSGELAEVVVTTAFGIKRAQRITPYSSQVVGDKELHIIPQTNINNALAGKIAGVQFRGQSPMKLNSQGSLRIRGGLDLTGDVAPIYVIDGSLQVLLISILMMFRMSPF